MNSDQETIFQKIGQYHIRRAKQHKGEDLSGLPSLAAPAPVILCPCCSLCVAAVLMLDWFQPLHLITALPKRTTDLHMDL